MKDLRGKHARRQDYLSVCSHEDCGLYAHTTMMDHDRKILAMPYFVGMTCFQIVHSEECRGLWTIIGAQKMTVSYSVNRSHRLYKYLHAEYGLPRQTRKRKEAGGEEEEEEVEEEEEEEANEAEGDSSEEDGSYADGDSSEEDGASADESGVDVAREDGSESV